jgi:hypothetical protein
MLQYTRRKQQDAANLEELHGLRQSNIPMGLDHPCDRLASGLETTWAKDEDPMGHSFVNHHFNNHHFMANVKCSKSNLSVSTSISLLVF